LLVAAALAGAVSASHASFHFARIAEVFLGTDADPNAQFVRIVAYANNQSQFANVQILVFDENGTALPNFHTIVNSLPSTLTAQESILIATAEAQAMLGITHDDDDGLGNNNPATGTLPDSGVVCFRRGATTPDCVAYGDYTGSTSVGGSEAGPPAASIPSGTALLRDFGANATLEAADDTNDSSADFFLGGPVATTFDHGSTVSDLRVSEAGNVVTLTWTNTTSPLSFDVHTATGADLVRSSVATATVGTMTWDDPDPASDPPNIVYYVVKP
jgi:hypothetical protein